MKEIGIVELKVQKEHSGISLRPGSMTSYEMKVFSVCGYKWAFFVLLIVPADRNNMNDNRPTHFHSPSKEVINIWCLN